MVFSIIFLIVMGGLSLFILTGKVDNLIAGYNTASKEERKKVILPRLRLVVASIVFLTSLSVVFPFLIGEAGNTSALLWSTFAVIPIVIVGLLLANTWCVRK